MKLTKTHLKNLIEEELSLMFESSVDNPVIDDLDLEEPGVEADDKVDAAAAKTPQGELLSKLSDYSFVAPLLQQINTVDEFRDLAMLFINFFAQKDNLAPAQELAAIKKALAAYTRSASQGGEKQVPGARMFEMINTTQEGKSMKITKSKLLKIITEEIKTLTEAVPPNTPIGKTSSQKLNDPLAIAAGRGSLKFPEDDEDEGESGFFYLENIDGRWGPASPAWDPHAIDKESKKPLWNGDPHKFAEWVKAFLDKKGRLTPTFNVYNGNPIEAASQNAILQVIGGEIQSPISNEWPDDFEATTSPEEEVHLSGDDPNQYDEPDPDRYDESKTRITKSQLQKFISKEITEALKRCH